MFYVSIYFCFIKSLEITTTSYIVLPMHFNDIAKYCSIILIFKFEVKCFKYLFAFKFVN